MQKTLFKIPAKEKTYRAIRHDVVRGRQKNNCPTVHHPNEKIKQLNRVLDGESQLTIYEPFAGHGNLTKEYMKYGFVIANEIKQSVFDSLSENVTANAEINRIDSYLDYHFRIYGKESFDVIDLDPYGFPNRMFPDIFLLIENGYMFVTMPKPYVNILNGITQVHLTAYYGNQNPDFKTVVEKIATWGICHWRKVELIEFVDLKSVWRMAFKVERVKATEYTGTKNR